MKPGPRPVGRPPGPSRPDTARIYELMKEFHCTYHMAYGIWRREQAAAGIRSIRGGLDLEIERILSRYPGLSAVDARLVAVAEQALERWRARHEGALLPDPLMEARKRLRAARLAGDVQLVEAIAAEIQLLQDAAETSGKNEPLIPCNHPHGFRDGICHTCQLRIEDARE